MSEQTTRPKAKVAGFSLRVYSSLYDLIILFAVTFLFVALPVTMIETTLESSVEKWVQNLLFFAVAYAYYVGFWHMGSGATTGMRTWKLMVADIDTGNKPSLLTASIRFLGFGITLISLGTTMVYLKTGDFNNIFFWLSSMLPVASMFCVLITPHKQTLHDVLARTSVYRVYT